MPYDCGSIGTYTKIDCTTDLFYNDKIIAFGIVKSSATADLSDPLNWTYANLAALQADVAVVDSATGEYDGGEPEVSTEAFGPKIEQITGRTHNATLKVEYNPKNWAFFNGLYKAGNKGVVFITGNYQQLFYTGNVNATIKPKNPITNDLKMGMKYEIVITWSFIEMLKPVAVTQDQIDLFNVAN